MHWSIGICKQITFQLYLYVPIRFNLRSAQTCILGWAKKWKIVPQIISGCSFAGFTKAKKSMVFWNFFSTRLLHSKIFQKKLILDFEAKSMVSKLHSFLILAHTMHLNCYSLMDGRMDIRLRDRVLMASVMVQKPLDMLVVHWASSCWWRRL